MGVFGVNSRKNSAGNVLFMVLIGCALFAALSYAVTKSGRTSTNPNREKAMLDAAGRVQFGSALTQALSKMKLAGGCEDTEFDFTGHKATSYNTEFVSYNYTNASAPADGNCSVFSSVGGNVIPRDFTALKTGLADPASVGTGVTHPYSWLVQTVRVLGSGSDAATAAGTDLVVFLGRMTRDQCLNFNTSVGVVNPGGVPPTDTWAGCGIVYTGSYTACPDPIGDTASSAGIKGKQDFCLYNPTFGDRFYQVHILLAR